MMRAIAPMEWVWIGRSWSNPVIFHRRREVGGEVVTRTATVDRVEHTALVPVWGFTVCGVLMFSLGWQKGWSDERNRFYLASPHGDVLPYRLLNPNFIRSCRRCFG